MTTLLCTLGNGYMRFCKNLNTLTPLLNLLIRLWIASIFFASGLTKIQSWQTTIALFENEYQVPILSPYLAAVLGTAAELALPILLILGLGTRLTALALFIFNIIAVYAYRTYLYDTGYAGLIAHFYWGFLLLIILIQGADKLSLDHILNNSLGREHNTPLNRTHIFLLGLTGALISLCFLTTIPTAWDSLPFWEAVQWRTDWQQGLIGYLGILVCISFISYHSWHTDTEY